LLSILQSPWSSSYPRSIVFVGFPSLMEEVRHGDFPSWLELSLTTRRNTF
jgi:hypothetical protein